MKKLLIILLPLLLYSCSVTEEVTEQEEEARSLSESEQRRAETAYIKGVSSHEMGEYDEALEYLSVAHRYLSNSAGVNYAMADVHFSQSNYNDAIYYAGEAVNAQPDSKWYRLLLARAYNRNNQDELAAEQFRTILDHHPDDINVYYRLANLHSRNSEYEKSNEVYREILRRTGPQRNIYYQMFQNYSSLDDEENAVKQLEEIRELEPGNLSIIQTLSQYYLQADQPEKAFEAINEALERNPDDPETLVNLADMYISEGEYEKGGEILTSMAADSLVQHDHKLEIAQFLISNYASNRDNTVLRESAEAVVDTIVAQYPEQGHSHVMAAEYYELVEDWPKVRHHLRETTELMPGHASAWQQRLQALYREEAYEEAIRVGKQADEQVPDDAMIKFFTGSAYLLEEREEEAVEWLREASEMPARRNMRSMIYGSLGDAYSSLDNWEKAKEAYRSAIEFDEENDVAMNNFAYYMAEEDENLEEAKMLAEKAVSMQPENASFLDTMGWVYFKLEKYEEAKRYINKALDTGEASATVKEHMGDVYEQLGDMDEARKWWRRALEEDESLDHLKERISGV